MCIGSTPVVRLNTPRAEERLYGADKEKIETNQCYSKHFLSRRKALQGRWRPITVFTILGYPFLPDEKKVISFERHCVILLFYEMSFFTIT